MSHIICSFQCKSVIVVYYFLLPYRTPSLITGKCDFYFLTYLSLLLLDSFTGNTTCTVNQGVSIGPVWKGCWNSKFWGMFALMSTTAKKKNTDQNIDISSKSLFVLFTGYTLFALFEYLVVFSNMAFHLTAVWDFKSREVMVISSSENKTFWLETPGSSAEYTTPQPPDDNSLDPTQEEEWDEGLFHICP